jgi:hypothetical protein
VLLPDSLVLHRHLPAGKGHQPGARCLVTVKQWGAAEGVGGGRQATERLPP